MIEELTIDGISLPKNWKMLPFGEVCEISGGSQPPKSTFIYEPKEGYIRLVQVRDYRTKKFITYIPKERAKKFCSKTDIMIGRYGPPIFGIFRGIEGAYNVALMKAIPNKELLNQEYLYWFLKTDTLVKFVEKSSKRAAGQDGVRKEVLYTYPTPIPPLNQQKLLVDIIIKSFAAIDTAKANAEQNLQNAKELFESYLQNVFENKGDDWEEAKWKEILEIRSGRNQKAVLDANGDYPILGSAGKVMGYANSYLCEANTTIIGRKGTINNPLFITTKFWNVDTAFGLHAGEKLTSKFLYYFCKSFDFTEMDKGSGRPSLVKTDLLQIKMSFPSISEQEQIIYKIDTFRSETKKLEVSYIQKIADLEEMKKSVLQKAFSGQLNTLN